MKRPVYETHCPSFGWTIVAHPWLARWRRNAQMRCSGCGTVVPSRSHAIVKLAASGSLEERIGREAERIRVRRGIPAIAALAAAEAVEMGREHGLRYDHLEFDETQLQWWGYYETGEHRQPTQIALPLVHATKATQTGIASLN